MGREAEGRHRRRAGRRGHQAREAGKHGERGRPEGCGGRMFLSWQRWDACRTECFKVGNKGMLVEADALATGCS